MNMQLENKTALVTGSTAGIGLAIATGLAGFAVAGAAVAAAFGFTTASPAAWFCCELCPHSVSRRSEAIAAAGPRPYQTAPATHIAPSQNPVRAPLPPPRARRPWNSLLYAHSGRDR